VQSPRERRHSDDEAKIEEELERGGRALLGALLGGEVAQHLWPYEAPPPFFGGLFGGFRRPPGCSARSRGAAHRDAGCATQLWALGLWDTGISFRLQGWIHSTKAAKPAHHPNG
jgi:hypothetical protein